MKDAGMKMLTDTGGRSSMFINYILLLVNTMGHEKVCLSNHLLCKRRGGLWDKSPPFGDICSHAIQMGGKSGGHLGFAEFSFYDLALVGGLGGASAISTGGITACLLLRIHLLTDGMEGVL